MARKKTSKKAEEEAQEEVVEETTKSKKASEKLIPITFKPQFSAATKKSINLKKPITTVVGGQTRTEYESQIPGLPPVFTLEKDEVYELTNLKLYMKEEKSIPLKILLKEIDKDSCLVIR